MKIIARTLVLLMSFGLTGCGLALEKWENQNNFIVAANPLCEEVAGKLSGDDGVCVSASAQLARRADNSESARTDTRGPLAIAAGAPTEREFLGQVINESEAKCGKFVNGLVLASNTTNVGLDIGSTIFSAVGSVVAPISTVHIFSALTSITSGTKTAFDADIYAKATIADYAQAIEQSYFTNINNYITELSNLQNESNLVESLEIAKLRSIHKNCSLASAQATIRNTLQVTGTEKTQNQVQVAIVPPVVAGAYTVTASQSAGGNALMPATFAAQAGQNPVAVAQGLQRAVNAIYGPAGVAASMATDGSASFSITAPSGFTWTAGPSGRITVSQTSAQNGTTTSTPPSPGTSLNQLNVKRN